MLSYSYLLVSKGPAVFRKWEGSQAQKAAPERTPHLYALNLLDSRDRGNNSLSRTCNTLSPTATCLVRAKTTGEKMLNVPLKKWSSENPDPWSRVTLKLGSRWGGQSCLRLTNSFAPFKYVPLSNCSPLERVTGCGEEEVPRA